MRRSSLALLLIITVLVGFAARSIVDRTAFPATSVSGSADTTAADAFYASLNSALAGGPVEPLAALLAEVFVDHDPSTGESRSAGEFLDRLRMMAAAPQGVRLDPVSAVGAGTTIVVAVAPTRVGSLQVAGMTLERELPGPYFETLRVVQGKVVDRWAPPIPWLQVAESTESEIWVPAMTQVVATLIRVTVAGGMVYEWNTDTAGILTIESGAGRWGMSSTGSAEAPEVLEPGDFVALPGGDRIRLRSVDSNPVTALLFLTAPARAADLSSTALTLTEVAAGISRSVLWSGPLSELDSITHYQPGSIVVPANTSIELGGAPEVLVSVDREAVDIAAPGGVVTLLGSDRWPEEHPGQARIDALHPGVVAGAETVRVSNQTDTSVVVFVISIEPESPA